MGRLYVFKLAIELSRTAFTSCSLLPILKRIAGELTFPNETDLADAYNPRPWASTRLGSPTLDMRRTNDGTPIRGPAFADYKLS